MVHSLRFYIIALAIVTAVSCALLGIAAFVRAMLGEEGQPWI